MTAAELLKHVGRVLGQDLCQQFIIPEIVSLAEDPVFRVRKATALNFHNICRSEGNTSCSRGLCLPLFA
jgi:serine/threonine-protein phosphatase 4 regulatory subunit 1